MKSQPRLRQLTSQILAATMLLLVFLASPVNAQESKEEKANPEQSKAAVDEAEQTEKDEIDAATVKLFAVPENASEEELLKYIAKAKRMLPKKRPSPKRLMEIRINSVIKACDLVIASTSDFELEKEMIQNQLGGLRVMSRYFPEDVKERSEAILKSLKDDTRPEMVAFLKSRKLAEKASGLSKLAADERKETLDSIFKDVESVGLSLDLYSALYREGRSLERSNPESAAGLYTRMADVMEGSKSPKMANRAKSLRGIIRRMNLLGSEMELVGQTIDGKTFDWSEYRGKVVLVDFWASWCGPCLREIPHVKEQLEHYGDKGFVVVGINMDDTKEKCLKCIDQKEITWVNLISDDPEKVGWDTPIAAHYGVKAIPTAILVDKDGKVVSMKARGKNLDKLLLELLGPLEEDEAAEPDQPADADAADPDAEKKTGA